MRERGTGQIREHGGHWQLRFYNGRGVRIEERTKFPADEKNRKKAERLLRKRTGAVDNGIKVDSRALRYADIRDSYLEQLEVDGAKSLRRGKDGKPYLEAVRRLDDYFEGFRTCEIGPDDIREYKRQQRAAGLTAGSINRSLASLRRMFTLAQQEEKLTNAPYIKMLTEAKARQGTLPHAQYAPLLAALPAYLRPVLTFGYRTGARLGEILALRWDDVLWLDSVVRIPDTKNDDPRDLVFADGDELHTMLRAQYAARQGGCDRVCFRVNRRGHAVPIGNFRKVWRRACCKLGLGQMEPVLDADGKPVLERPRYKDSKPKPKMVYHGLIFHDLRRTFISDAEHAGAPRHEVMKLSGHRSEATYKRYAISNRDRRRAVVAQIDKYRSQQPVVQGHGGDKLHHVEAGHSVTQ